MLLLGVGAILAGWRGLASGLAQLRGALTDGEDGESCGNGDKKHCRVYTVSGISDRIKRIKQMIRKYSKHPEFKRVVAAELSRRCGRQWCVPPRDYKGEVDAIFVASRDPATPIGALFSWVKGGVRYTRDHSVYDDYASPLKTLEWGTGDCDDACVLLVCALQNAGFDDIALRVYRTHDSPDWDHIATRVNVNSGTARKPKWVTLDTTVEESYPGWEPGPDMIAEHKDFKV